MLYAITGEGLFSQRAFFVAVLRNSLTKQGRRYIVTYQENGTSMQSLSVNKYCLLCYVMCILYFRLILTAVLSKMVTDE